MIEYLKTLEKYIAKDELELAFDDFREKLSSIVRKAPKAEPDILDVKNQIIVLSGKFHDLNKRSNLGTIEASTASTIKTQIVYAFSQLINNLSNYKELYAYLKEKDEEETWLSAANFNSMQAVEEYIEKYPNGKYSVEAKHLLCELKKMNEPKKVEFFDFQEEQAAQSSNLPIKSDLEWWNSLSPIWKRIFRAKLTLSEKPTLDQLQDIFNITKLNILGNREVLSIEPLRQLKKLRFLNISDTKITSLSALENLENLEIIWFRYTSINSLLPLKTLKNLKGLDFDNTEVGDLSPISDLPNLKHLSCAITNVNSLYPLYDMPNLSKLNCTTHLLSNESIEQFKLMNNHVKVNEY